MAYIATKATYIGEEEVKDEIGGDKMKAMCIEKVNEGIYKGVIMCKSSESSALTSSEVTLEGNTITLIDGSIALEVDTNAQYILYNGAWYKNE